MTHALFTDDAKLKPYWWEAAPRPSLAAAPLPARTDVAVIGSGFAGLSAALTLARAGRDVTVFEAGAPGIGASSRNGGMCGGGYKLSFSRLAGELGTPAAAAIYREGQAALDYLAELIAAEQIACHFARMGRFVGAHARSDYEAMARESELQRRHAGIEADMVPKAEQHAELGTDAYQGGRVVHGDGGLQPALYHQGLLERALNAGARVLAETPVQGIARDDAGFRLATARGASQAAEVIVATNGYTGAATPFFRRRLIPVGSFMIATEPLAPETLARLMPKGRMISDTKRLLSYYRPAPDAPRILFGGRAAFGLNEDLRRTGAILHRHLCTVFPELEHTRISHSWTGNVAFTFDRMPHIGVKDGIHYAVGYCGSGVVRATFYGHKAALKILGDRDATTALDDRPFPTMPFYTGRPWFLPLVSAWYGLRDRLAR